MQPQTTNRKSKERETQSNRKQKKKEGKTNKIEPKKRRKKKEIQTKSVNPSSNKCLLQGINSINEHLTVIKFTEKKLQL